MAITPRGIFGAVGSFFVPRYRRGKPLGGGGKEEDPALTQALASIDAVFRDYDVPEQVLDLYQDDFRKAFNVRYGKGPSVPWKDVPFIKEALSDPRLRKEKLVLGGSLNLGVNIYDLYTAPEKIVSGWGKMLQSTFSNDIAPYIENRLLTPEVFNAERGIGRAFADDDTVKNVFSAYVTQRETRGARLGNFKVLEKVLKTSFDTKFQSINSAWVARRQMLSTQISNLDSQLAGLSPTNPRFDVLSHQLNTQRAALIQQSTQITREAVAQAASLNQSFNQLTEYARLRNIHYGVYNFLAIWRKDGFGGVLKEYAWKTVSKKLGVLYPPKLIESLAGKITFLAKPLDIINRARAKLAGMLVKYGTQFVKWAAEKLGLRALFAAIGSALAPGAGTALGAVLGGVVQFFFGWAFEAIGGILKYIGYGLAGFAVVFIALIVLITGFFSIILGNHPYPWERTVAAGACPIDQIAEIGGGGGTASCNLCNTSAYSTTALSANERRALPNGIPPLMKRVLEAAGRKYGVPASLLLATMHTEGAFGYQNLSWTDENVRKYSSCAAKEPIPNCRSVTPSSGAAGPFGWLPSQWPSFSDAVLEEFPNRDKQTLSECNFVDAAFAAAKAIQRDKGHLTNPSVPLTCAGVSVYRGNVRPTSCSDWDEGRIVLARMQYSEQRCDNSVTIALNTFRNFTCGR